MALNMNEEKMDYRCFICWDDIDFNDTSTKIVSACNCISTDFKYTHKDCLNLWINQNRHTGLKCQVCGCPFHVKKVLKPFKKIYKENWKVLNCLFFTVILINTLLWMICAEWNNQLEKINSNTSHYNENSEIEPLTQYDEWIVNYDERETYFEDYLSQISYGFLLRNIYINAATIFIILNTTVFVVYFYHEKEKFIEYSIDSAYEYKGNTNYFKFLKKKKDQSSDPMVSENNNNNQHLPSNFEYQKIRVV